MNQHNISEISDGSSAVDGEIVGVTHLLIQKVKSGCQFHQPIVYLPTGLCFGISFAGFQEVLPFLLSPLSTRVPESLGDCHMVSFMCMKKLVMKT